jgi:hypothetical protein
VIDGDVPERAVLGDDRASRRAVARLGVRREPVSREGVGDRLHRSAHRALRVAGRHLLGERAAVVLADQLGHAFGLDRVDHREGAGEQPDHQIVHRRWRGERRLVRGHPVALGRSPGTRAEVLHVHVQVTAAGQLVEVVPGDVRVQLETGRHLGSRHSLAILDEEVDVPARRIAESRGDRRDGSREDSVVPLGCSAGD